MSTPRLIWSRFGPCTPWCEVGIGNIYGPTGLARWDRARWDAVGSRWSGVEPAWLDVSCDVVDASSDAGRTAVTDRFRPGTAEVTFRNDDGWADLTGIVDPAALTLRPGRAIRWGVDTPAGRQILYRGFLDELVPMYDPAGNDVTQANAVDALGDVGRAYLAAQTPAWAGDTVTARLTRLLDAVAWPTTKRRLDPSSVTLLATGLGARLVDELGVTAESAGGSVFGDLDGNVTYRARDWQAYRPTDPPAATIGNVEVADVCPQAWELSFRRSDATARATIGNTAGTVVVRTDEATRLALGPEPFERVDLLSASSATLTTLAERIIATRNVSTFPRVEAVTLDAAQDPGDGSTIAVMAGARPETATRYRCRLRQRGRVVFDELMLVTSVRHVITGSGQWTCRIGLADAAPFATVAGRWDRARWDRAQWGDAVAVLTATARRALEAAHA